MSKRTPYWTALSIVVQNDIHSPALGKWKGGGRGGHGRLLWPWHARVEREDGVLDGKLRAAVIGAGWYAAQNHIPALLARPEVVLDGVSRLGADELERVRAHFGFRFGSEDAAAVKGLWV